MISNCPHCQKPLNMSDGQKAKIKAALSKLKPSHPLKFGCPICKKSIELNRNGGVFRAEGQMPGDRDVAKKEKPVPDQAAKGGPNKTPSPRSPDHRAPDPPKPPDISWITSGKMEEKGTLQDVKRALVLVKEASLRSKVAEALQSMDLQVSFPETVVGAVKEMEFKKFASVVFHLDFEGVSLSDSTFHRHMSGLSMAQRRYMFYALIGSEFSTLYDLEALAFSANVVINDKETAHIETILKKSQYDYDELFGPLLTSLKAHGKR